MLGMAGSSKAETHTITVDNGRLTMGFRLPSQQDPPGRRARALDPNISNTSGSGTIAVETSGSTATVAEADFNIPIVWIPDPTAGGAFRSR